MQHFRDTCAIVTGGASGIGRSLCEVLGQEGAFTIVADINFDGAKKIASAINNAGGRASATHLNVTRAEEMQKVVAETASEQGRIDFMFNNAGVAIGAEMYDIDNEHWRRIIDVNLMGVVYGSSMAYSLMVKQGFGHIVNISSLSGLIGHPTAVPYATTKSAIIGLSTSLRAEAVKIGVNVSVACPGFVQTGIFDAATMINARKKDVISTIPFKMMNADQAAKKILRGVECNRAIIVFPFYARLLWWFYRIHPGLITPVAKKMLHDFRTAKKVSQL